MATGRVRSDTQNEVSVLWCGSFPLALPRRMPRFALAVGRARLSFQVGEVACEVSKIAGVGSERACLV